MDAPDTRSEPRPAGGRSCHAARWIPLGALSAALFGCGEPASRAPDLPGVDAGPLVISGTYDVSGRTVDVATGAARSVSGTVIVVASEDGRTYDTSFQLTTTLRRDGDPQQAELVGTGEGTIDGGTLEGSAETQLIVALVPGVDADFGLMPRAATTRIANRSRAVVAPDGSVEIHIESEALPGEEEAGAYGPTHTTLRGRRVDVLGRRAD